MQCNKSKTPISGYVCISKMENNDSTDDAFDTGGNCKGLLFQMIQLEDTNEIIP